MINLTREEAQQVLECLFLVGVNNVLYMELDETEKVIKTIRAKLSEPKPEPVAWGVPNTRPTEKAQFMMLLHSTNGVQYPELLVPLYEAPPQREPEPEREQNGEQL